MTESPSPSSYTARFLSLSLCLFPLFRPQSLFSLTFASMYVEITNLPEIACTHSCVPFKCVYQFMPTHHFHVIAFWHRNSELVHIFLNAIANRNHRNRLLKKKNETVMRFFLLQSQWAFFCSFWQHLIDD